MADTSLLSLISYLKENGIVDSKYENFENDLLSSMYLKYIYPENVKANILDLAKKVVNPKITRYHDCAALTLDKDEAKNFIDMFNKHNPNLKVSSLQEIINKPNDIFARVEHCEKYGIPYKDEEDVLFSEITNEVDGIRYLKTKKYIEGRDIYKDKVDVDKFVGLCALIQKRMYEISKTKFPIDNVTEQSLIEIINLYPDLDVDQLYKEIIKNADENSVFSILKVDINLNYEDENNSFERNGRR